MGNLTSFTNDKNKKILVFLMLNLASLLPSPRVIILRLPILWKDCFTVLFNFKITEIPQPFQRTIVV